MAGTVLFIQLSYFNSKFKGENKYIRRISVQQNYHIRTWHIERCRTRMDVLEWLIWNFIYSIVKNTKLSKERKKFELKTLFLKKFPVQCNPENTILVLPNTKLHRKLIILTYMPIQDSVFMYYVFRNMLIKTLDAKKYLVQKKNLE